MDVFELGFLFFIYGCRLGFWYEILAKGLLVCRFLLYSHIFHYYYLCFYVLWNFVRERAVGLVNLRALGVWRPKKKNRGNVFTFGCIWDCVILVITGIFCTGSFLHLGGNGLLVSFSSVFIFFLFPSKNPPPCSCSGSCYGCYTFSRDVTTFFYFLCFIFVSALVWCIWLLFCLSFALALCFCGRFFVFCYIIFVLLTRMRDYTREKKLFSTFRPFLHSALRRVLSRISQHQASSVLFWFGQTNVMTLSDEDQLVLSNRK